MDGTTDADEVLAVLAALEAAGCRAWVDGGWGVDALAGRQTRPHRDLDLALDADRLDTALSTLGALGYTVQTDWLPTRVELHRPGRGRVDLHPLAFDAGGDGLQTGPDGETYRYPRDGFVAGRIAGAVVGCLSREVQIAFHSGYELRDVDHHDLAVLAGLAEGT